MRERSVCDQETNIVHVVSPSSLPLVSCSDATSQLPDFSNIGDQVRHSTTEPICNYPSHSVASLVADHQVKTQTCPEEATNQRSVSIREDSISSGDFVTNGVLGKPRGLEETDLDFESQSLGTYVAFWPYL